MNQWIISYKNYNPKAIRLRETLLTLGNGYFAARGAHEDGSSEAHYPATYFAGVYNRTTSKIANQTIINEDLINAPNWLPITFKTEDGAWFDINKVEILSYCEMLHLKKGIVKRSIRFKDKEHRIFLIHTLRFVSQNNPHLAGIRYSIISENWEGTIKVRSSLIGDVRNNGVPRYRGLNNKHLEVIKKGTFDNDYLYLQAKTINSHIECAEVTKTELYKNKMKLSLESSYIEEDSNVHLEFSVPITPYQKINVLKTLSIYNSKDFAIYETLYEAKKLIKSEHPFKTLLNKHILAWDHLWYTADIEIESKTNEQQLIRFHLFHTLQCLSKHSINLDYGAAARGLHGEAYRGHVFWDEVYILPYFFLHFPEIARSLLMYRYNRLNAARRSAKEHGYEGAMFPWQSASNGEEQTQKIHLNPQSSTWGPDYSRLQRHVNLAIIYNIWGYFQSTGDNFFLNHYGAELIFEIAKFISSLTTYNTDKKKYEINGVMGPDEYHENYLNSGLGLNNNTYTNVLTVWCLEKALELTALLSKKRIEQLFELLHINAHQLRKWKKITRTLFIPFHENILSQFEGYKHLKEFHWTYYKEKYSQIERLDRILKAENKNPNLFQIAKQPDTLMLFYLLGDKEVKRILTKLGYRCSDELIYNTIQYYLKRTSHGSTLSKITCASILYHKEPETSAQLYHEALLSDLNDTQNGTTEEGIHLGVMISTTFFLLKDIAGLEVKNDLLAINPKLPTWLNRLKFKVIFKQNTYGIEITRDSCFVTLYENNFETCISIQNELIYLPLDKTLCFPLHKTKSSEEKKTRKQPLSLPF